MDFGNTGYTDSETGKKVVLPFPDKLLVKLAAQHQVDINNLSLDDIDKLFAELVGLWFEGQVMTEELSSIANYFLTITGYENDKLSRHLMAASELSYYIRHTNAESGLPLHDFVTGLREYHQKYKSV